MSLRFIERDGKKILQHQVLRMLDVDSGNKTYEWVDVPLVEEPKKPREFWVNPVEGKFMHCSSTVGAIIPANSKNWIRTVEVLE